MRPRVLELGIQFLVGLVAMLSVLGCHSPQQLTPGEMETSFEYVVSKVKTVHPRAVDGLPPKVVEAVTAARAKIEVPLTSDQFFLVLSELLTSLEDAHSHIDRYNEPAKNRLSLALPFLWLEDGLVVTEDVGELQRGDVIRAIGDFNESEILAGLRKIVSAENDHHIRALAPEKLVRKEYLRHFDLTEQGVSLRIERNGVIKEVHLSFKLRQATAEAQGSGASQPFSYTVDPSRSLGILRLDHCTYNAAYVALLREFMTKVAEQGAQRIAVDLRRNRGGNVLVAFAFLNYLEADFRSFSIEQWVSEAFSQQYAPFVRDEFLVLLKSFGVDLSQESYKIPGEAVRAIMSQLLGPPEAEPQTKFRGQIYVLTSPATFSSANLFATLVQDNGLGLVVGEPTGNAINFHGQAVHFEVPGTEFRLSLATSLNLRPANLPNQSTIQPDIEVPTTIEDIRTGRDPQIEWLHQNSSL